MSARPLRPLSAYASMPVPGSGGDRFRLADAKPGPCETCGEVLVGFTFGGASGWLCPACDVEHYGELEKLGARHCSGCDHTEHEHWEPRFAPRCAVLSCPCGRFQ